MARNTLHRIALAFALASVLAAVGCSTAVPTGTPGVDRIGAAVLRYQGLEIEVMLSYRFANSQEGGDWLFLDIALTGSTRASVEIKREKIALRIPSGEIVALPLQQEFGAAYSKLAAMIARADVAAEPLDYYPNRVPKALDFLVPPGSGIAYQSVWVNDLDVATGRLYFALPADVQPGPYELRIDLPETKVRIPFRLGQDQRPTSERR